MTAQPALVWRTFETAPVGMAFQIVVGPDGADRRFSFVGRRCQVLNGVPADAAMADASLLYDMIVPEHRAAFSAAEAQAMAERRPFDIEVAMRRADGEVRWHRICSMPSVQPDGSTIWDGLQIDITESRRVAAELAEQRRRLELAVEATGLGFWEWELRTGDLVWSDRNKAAFGLEPDEPITIGRYMELVHPEDLDRVKAAFLDTYDRPRGGDFSVEHRAVTPTGEVRWMLSHGRVETDAQGPTVVVGTTLDITERRAVEERRTLLMGELAHRAKNGIAVVLAIVNQTARSAESVPQFEELLTARMQAMAHSQDLVTEAGGRPVAISQLAQKVLAPFGLDPFELDAGLDQVMVNGDVASGLALLFHEMATNAVKHGSLSNGQGRVAIARAGEFKPGMAAVSWRESGGPPARAPGRRGFGSKLLEAALRGLGGKVEAAFHEAGFEARVEFPREG